jgi:PAS domain S-box-containing protein
MKTEDLLTAFIESIPDPVVLCDTNHIVKVANKVAEDLMYEGKSLVGHNMFESHKEESMKIVVEVLERLEKGEEEVQITNKEEGKQRTFMRAIRDADGKLVGYYERFMYWPERIV